MAESTSLPFQIRVLEGPLSTSVMQTGQSPGILQLVGRGLPFRPMKFGTSQRMQTQFYPGNPEGSQLPIGPKLKPSTFSGEWNDKYLGDGQAMALKTLLETICETGVSVEVTWPMASIVGDATGQALGGEPTVRVGLISDFDWTFLFGIEDIGWEAAFQWRKKGGVTAQPPIAATGTVNAREGFNDVAADLSLAKAMGQAMLESPQVGPFGLPQKLTDGFNQAFAAIDSTVNAVSGAAGAVVSATVIPAAAAQQLLASCQSGVQACLNAIDTVATVNRLLLEVADSALDIIRLVEPLFAASLQFATAAETCCDASAGVQQATDPDVLALVRAPAGTDLRDLALRYYGDADGWWAIAQANDIDGSAVPAAPTGPSDDPYRPIVIPRRQAGSTSDLASQC